MSKRKNDRLPDFFEAKLSVEVPYYTKDYQSTDGSPVETEPILDALWEGRTKNPEPLGYINYSGKVTRHDGQFTARLEWVHIDGKGGSRVTLPHKAVLALLRAVESTNKQARSASAEKAAETRRRNGVVPFEKKDTG